MKNAKRSRMVTEKLACLKLLTLAKAKPTFRAGLNNRARMGIEVLESRDLMASSLTASLSGGLLRIEGTNVADTIHVRQLGAQIQVDEVAIQTGGGNQAGVAAASVNRVEIFSLGGNDEVWMGDAAQGLGMPASLLDGAAGDTLFS